MDPKRRPGLIWGGLCKGAAGLDLFTEHAEQQEAQPREAPSDAKAPGQERPWRCAAPRTAGPGWDVGSHSSRMVDMTLFYLKKSWAGRS